VERPNDLYHQRRDSGEDEGRGYRSFNGRVARFEEGDSDGGGAPSRRYTGRFEHFQKFEYMVRVIFNFLFCPELGEGRLQSRTEAEEEGVEIRDLVFATTPIAASGSLKEKYSASEIVADAKNKDKLTRDDLRQLYCYLKPALGFWGFIICRSEQPAWIRAFNRTLFKNFSQERGLLILCHDDLRRMVQMKNRNQEPTEYLRNRMAEFIRSI
jgi:hypothetical protein